MPFSGKQLLLFAASPGALGGVRSLWHSRVPLEVLNVHVYPEMQGVPHADQVFDEQGKIKDEKTRTRMEKLVKNFLEFIRR